MNSTGSPAGARMHTHTHAHTHTHTHTHTGFQLAKNPPASAGDIGDVGLIPGSGRSSGGGHGNPLQCSCLENSHV